MKHYVLPYFPQTLQAFIQKYLVKYGDNETNLREGTGWNWNSPHDFVANSEEARAKVPSGQIGLNQSLNKHGEINGNVILSKQGLNPLARVEPWDMLMVLGHGVVVGGSAQARLIGSDPQAILRDGSRRPVTGFEAGQGWERRVNGSQGALYANSTEVANWLDGKLKRNHVLLKLVMCLGGGPFGEHVPDTNFAKELATLLYGKGYHNIAVGGYRGTVETGVSARSWTLTSNGRQTTVRGGDLPLGNMVVSEDDSERAAGKDNLDYFHGTGASRLSKNAITVVKRIFRRFGGVGNTRAQLEPLVGAANRAGEVVGDGTSHEFVMNAVRMLVEAEQAHRLALPPQVVPQVGQQVVPQVGQQVVPQQPLGNQFGAPNTGGAGGGRGRVRMVRNPDGSVSWVRD